MRALTAFACVFMPLVALATPPTATGRNAKYVAKYLGLPGAKVDKVERSPHRGWYRYHFTIETPRGTIAGYRDSSFGASRHSVAFAPTTITSPKNASLSDAWRMTQSAK